MDLQNGSLGESSDDPNSKKAIYSMPGILHFIQHEWSRFEIERAQWDVERAELQARIAFLQGERKGQENLKRDLIRRIKMLEYALKQERAKVHKYKFGTDLKVDPKPIDSDDSRSSTGEIPPANSNVTWRHGRQLLRQYLQEVGYSDTILDVRSQRVRALLGNNYDANNKDNDNKIINGDVPMPEKQRSPGFISQEKGEPSENEVLKEFSFLEGMKENDEDIQMGEEEVDGGDQQRSSRAKASFEDSDKYNGTEQALAEFAFLNHEEQEIVDPKLTDWSVDQNKLNAMKEQFRLEKRQTKRKGSKRPDKKNLQSMLDKLCGAEVNEEELYLGQEDQLPYPVGGPHMADDSIQSVFGLGELAGLTVANEADPLSFEISGKKEAYRRTWTPKFALRSHFDGVRSVRFLPNDAALITASEDHTLKLWNLNKPLSNKKAQCLDVESIYCFRGHTGPVLCSAVDLQGSSCFSGSTDTTIRCWNVPSIETEAYDAYDASVVGPVLIGHTDAVWSLSYCESRQQLLSASADMSIKLWAPFSSDPLLQTILVEGDATPTCVEFVRCDTNQAVASNSNGKIVLFDLETGKIITTLAEGDGGRVNTVVSHPTMATTISAHDDGHIKFFDNTSGKLTHSMVAHLDSVSCLSVDPNGLYLLSGSHDCSIRLWNLDSKTCIQELTAHRKKFDESIYSVAFHPNASYIASAGADAMTKVFV